MKKITKVNGKKIKKPTDKQKSEAQNGYDSKTQKELNKKIKTEINEINKKIAAKARDSYWRSYGIDEWYTKSAVFIFQIFNKIKDYRQVSAMFTDPEETAKKKAEYQEQMEELYLKKRFLSEICDKAQKIPIKSGDGAGFGLATFPGGSQKVISSIQGKYTGLGNRSEGSTVMNKIYNSKITEDNVSVERTEVAVLSSNRLRDTNHYDEYLYKITYFMNNPDLGEDESEDLEYQVRLYGEQDIDLFEEKKELAPGDSHYYTKKSMIIFYSEKKYTKLCIEIEGLDQILETDEICSRFVFEDPTQEDELEVPSDGTDDDDEDEDDDNGELNDDL